MTVGARSPWCPHAQGRYSTGPGSPRAFYESLGFLPTGEVIDGDEDVLVVDLDDL